MGNHSAVYRSKEKSDSREWSAVMNAAKMSGRLGTFYLKMSIRFKDEEVFGDFSESCCGNHIGIA